MPSKLAFKIESEIGFGAFSRVFRAHEISSGRLVALKTSRVSSKIPRTILHHEASILQLLVGHPAIPFVIGYGRSEHFEYLAMELLGRSLCGIVTDRIRLPLQSVLFVADQMLSVLEHIHRHGIVHRDIKPGNIMTTHELDCSSIFLIDFGLARPCLRGPLSIHNLVEERRHLTGTLTFASLNAHEGIDLSPRDDLESLAYTLLFLLRGELPWGRYKYHGTALGRMAQVKEKKRRWSGSKLAEGHPPLFGQLLEYARGLAPEEPLDYNRFRTEFNQLQQLALPERDRINSKSQSQSKTPDAGIEIPSCPVEIGQLVHVQVDARVSIEGYSIQAGDTSFWHNVEFTSHKWSTSAKPAIVINTVFDARSSCHKILVVSLGCGIPATGTKIVAVSVAPSPHVLKHEVVTQPEWPKSQTYCYAFPHAYWFYCLPGQAHASTYWKIGSEDVELLRKTFPVPRAFGNTINDPNPDVRYNTRMSWNGVKFFVNVTTLGPSSMGNPVDWQGDDRGWFDERVKIARRQGFDNGVYWTGHPTFSDDEYLPDSYSGSDLSCWGNRQQGRDQSLTLDSDQIKTMDGRSKLPTIVEVRH